MASSGSAESPTTLPSGAMKVTRAPSSAPIRSASGSSAAALVAVAGIALRASSSAVSRASATSVSSIRASVRRCIDCANSTPATTRAMIVDESAERSNFARKLTVIAHQLCVVSRGRVEELVAELLHRHQRVGQQRQLLAKPPHVHVDGPRAAGVSVPPHVGEQHVARQHAAPVLEQI